MISYTTSEGSLSTNYLDARKIMADYWLMSDEIFDLLIVGGGINGAGIAADAAGRGLSVVLCEQGDLANATSSASSKLIHGGLRYLEHWEFRLVHKALVEREVLLRKAPHLIQPQRFVLPHCSHLRPRWLIRLGLFLYDHLAKRGQLPSSRGLHFSNNENNPLKEKFENGFEYFDCKVDDARLVVANAMQARQHGATILTRTCCRSASRENGLWHATLEDISTGACQHLVAKTLVNATGPWVQSFLEVQTKRQTPKHVRLVKGSHFVVKKLYQGEQAYLLQNNDKRIVFVTPFFNDFTLVGTTDTEFSGDPSKAIMDDEEEAYLLLAVNDYFAQQLHSNDILWRYSGVRALCDDESASSSELSRDYIIELEVDKNNQAPLLSVFGGKITTYRKLAETALGRLKPFFPQMTSDWTAEIPLAGGDISCDSAKSFNQWLDSQAKIYPDLSWALLSRLGHAYGSKLGDVLDGAMKTDDLGFCFGGGLYQCEVEYLVKNEWAKSAEDVLWRRSKLGLYFGQKEVERLELFIASLLK